MKNKRKQSRRRGGFTIVEVLVVVIIIAALASLIVPRFFGRVGQANQSVARNAIGQIEVAIEMFSADYGRLPETLDELVSRPSDITAEDWQSPSLRAKDLLDPWNRPYEYTLPGEHDSAYDLFSLGADGQTGGEKENADVCNWEK